MRIARSSIVCAFVPLFLAGCVVRVRPLEPVVTVDEGPAVVETAPAEVTVDGPVFEAPGVEVIDVEPAPDARVYVYDPGYPPGTYFYGGFYFYGGYRYPHDVFINRYVEVNVREHRFADAEANRRAGREIEARHREEFARTGGHRDAAAVRADRQHAAQQRSAAARTPAANRARPAAEPQKKSGKDNKNQG